VTLTSGPGRGRLLPPFTLRFRLGFALLRGGSRINHHRAGVLSREGCPLVHSVLTPLTVPTSGLPNAHRIILCLIPLFGPPATPTRCISLLPPGLPSCSQAVQSPSSPTGLDCHGIGDARLQRLAVISWDLGVLGGGRVRVGRS